MHLILGAGSVVCVHAPWILSVNNDVDTDGDERASRGQWWK